MKPNAIYHEIIRLSMSVAKKPTFFSQKIFGFKNLSAYHTFSHLNTAVAYFAVAIDYNTDRRLDCSQDSTAN